MMRLGVLLLCIWFAPVCVLAQNTGEQLASQYFSNGEFDKAADEYERLLNKNPSSGYYYDNLLGCYFNLKKFEEAEKVVKKQQRRFSDNYYFKVDLGFVYKKQGNNESAQKSWNKLLSEITGYEEQAKAMASAFQKRGETGYAVLTYEAARKKGNSPRAFSFELAGLYGDQKETVKMVTEYMVMLESYPDMLDDVEGYLQNYMEQGEMYETVKTTILKKYKERPSDDVLNELLIWLYVQHKEFNNAFMQARAMDKRKKEQGSRILPLANLALQNEYYDDAANMFAYLIALGSDNANYMNARVGSLSARKQKVIRTTQYTQADLFLLEADYNAFLTEFGRYYYTASVLLDLARLEAYHLNDYNKAIPLFNELISMQRLDNAFKASCKLELGDIYLMKGEQWDAMLLYGQVDKDFKEEPLGQEAKYRNAKLSYYIGEFEWARAQLDVLKTATTQLIANNAMELSLLIQDNTLDSIEEPLLLFAQADLYYYQNNTSGALLLLDSIDKEFPRHSLADDILMKRAELAIKEKKHEQAVSYLKQLLDEHGSDILGDNALFMLADITEHQLNDKAEAQKLYENFLSTYPGSFFTTEVRKRYRALRGDVLN